MDRSLAKRSAKTREWQAVDLHAPRRSAHQEKSGASAFRQPLNLRELFAEFPCSSPKALDDQQMAGHIRIALSRYQSARQHHVPRKDFRAAAKAIAKHVTALRVELARPKIVYTAHAAVLYRVDEITGRETTVVLKAELIGLSDALAKALELEPERGNLRDEPFRALVYDLSAVYRARTGLKPSREFNHSAKWLREKPDGRQRREQELDGNDFARFILLIERAYLAGLRAYLIKRHKPTGEGLSERDLKSRAAKFAFGEIRRAVISIVDLRRAERWR
jgi:hypothetical protein